MTSTRFPGKILAPLHGKPVLAHTVGRVSSVLPLGQVVIATSTDPTDDPVACYGARLGARVVRGSLLDVVARFQQCLAAAPCEWFFRICGDSPYPDGDLMRTFLRESRAGDWDLITNVFPRTFPKGRSLELVRASAFAKMAAGDLTAEQREHVTKGLYDQPNRFRIHNIAAAAPAGPDVSFVVDEVADLRRLEGLAEPA